MPQTKSELPVISIIAPIGKTRGRIIHRNALRFFSADLSETAQKRLIFAPEAVR